MKSFNDYLLETNYFNIHIGKSSLINGQWVNDYENINLMNNEFQKAANNWHSDLRSEYKDLSNNVFDICYDEAYDRGHHAGYDEVVYQMEHIVIFAKKILNMCKFIDEE